MGTGETTHRATVATTTTPVKKYVPKMDVTDLFTDSNEERGSETESCFSGFEIEDEIKCKRKTTVCKVKKLKKKLPKKPSNCQTVQKKEDCRVISKYVPRCFLRKPSKLLNRPTSPINEQIHDDSMPMVHIINKVSPEFCIISIGDSNPAKKIIKKNLLQDVGLTNTRADRKNLIQGVGVTNTQPDRKNLLHDEGLTNNQPDRKYLLQDGSLTNNQPDKKNLPQGVDLSSTQPDRTTIYKLMCSSKKSSDELIADVLSVRRNEDESSEDYRQFRDDHISGIYSWNADGSFERNDTPSLMVSSDEDGSCAIDDGNPMTLEIEAPLESSSPVTADREFISDCNIYDIAAVEEVEEEENKVVQENYASCHIISDHDYSAPARICPAILSPEKSGKHDCSLCTEEEAAQIMLDLFYSRKNQVSPVDQTNFNQMSIEPNSTESLHSSPIDTSVTKDNGIETYSNMYQSPNTFNCCNNKKSNLPVGNMESDSNLEREAQRHQSPNTLNSSNNRESHLPVKSDGSLERELQMHQSPNTLNSNNNVKSNLLVKSDGNMDRKLEKCPEKQTNVHGISLASDDKEKKKCTQSEVIVGHLPQFSDQIVELPMEEVLEECPDKQRDVQIFQTFHSITASDNEKEEDFTTFEAIASPMRQSSKSPELQTDVQIFQTHKWIISSEKEDEEEVTGSEVTDFELLLSSDDSPDESDSDECQNIQADTQSLQQCDKILELDKNNGKEHLKENEFINSQLLQNCYRMQESANSTEMDQLERSSKKQTDFQIPQNCDRILEPDTIIKEQLKKSPGKGTDFEMLQSITDDSQRQETMPESECMVNKAHKSNTQSCTKEPQQIPQEMINFGKQRLWIYSPKEKNKENDTQELFMKGFPLNDLKANNTFESHSFVDEESISDSILANEINEPVNNDKEILDNTFPVEISYPFKSNMLFNALGLVRKSDIIKYSRKNISSTNIAHRTRNNRKYLKQTKECCVVLEDCRKMLGNKSSLRIDVSQDNEGLPEEISSKIINEILDINVLSPVHCVDFEGFDLIEENHREYSVMQSESNMHEAPSTRHNILENFGNQSQNQDPDSTTQTISAVPDLINESVHLDNSESTCQIDAMNEKRAQCPTCSKSCLTKSRLERHIARTHKRRVTFRIPDETSISNRIDSVNYKFSCPSSEASQSWDALENVTPAENCERSLHDTSDLINSNTSAYLFRKRRTRSSGLKDSVCKKKKSEPFGDEKNMFNKIRIASEFRKSQSNAVESNNANQNFYDNSYFETLIDGTSCVNLNLNSSEIYISKSPEMDKTQNLVSDPVLHPAVKDMSDSAVMEEALDTKLGAFDIVHEPEDVKVPIICIDMLNQEESSIDSPHMEYALRGGKENISDVISAEPDQKENEMTAINNIQAICKQEEPKVTKCRIKHETVYSNGRKMYPCSVCRRNFSTSGDMLRHLRTHTNERPYKCTVCPSAFKQRGALKKHLEMHKGSKPYSCHICQYKFSQKIHLKVHMRTHTGERPYKCAYCNKGFSQMDHLRDHLNIHTLERPHKCKVCNRGFKSHGNLTKHRRIHEEEKRYQCEHCARTFISAQCLRVHNRVHTGERPFRCTVCDMFFRFENNLRKHVTIKHPEFMVKGVVLFPRKMK